MPNRPIRNLKAGGQFRREAGTTSAPDAFASVGVVAPTSVMSEVLNQNVPIHRLYGDGRVWGPVLAVTPSSPVPGQTWIETVSGQDLLAYVDSGGTIRYIAPSAVTPTTVLPLTQLSPVPNVLASVPVDSVGLARFSLGIVNQSTGDRLYWRVTLGHNGTALADATAVQIGLLGDVVIGSTTPTLSVDLIGSGVTQQMRLLCQITAVGSTAYLVRDQFSTP